MAQENKYTAFLGEIASSGPTIQMLALTDLSGDLKCLIQQPTAAKPNPDIENTHIFLGWAVAQSFVQFGSFYSFNNLQIVTIEYQHGILFLAPFGRGILIILTDAGTNVEVLRQKLPIYSQELSKLEDTIETPPVTILDDLLRDFDSSPFSTH